MGVLKDFDLEQLIERYGCRAFVETGTGAGEGVAYAASCGFELIYSVEIMHGLALAVALRFAKDQRITIIHGKSESGLKEAVQEIPPSMPVVFWLDAHYPGVDYRIGAPKAEKNETVRLPLERELRLLASLRDLSSDVVLIDDLRIYEDGPYEKGPCPLDRQPRPENRHVRYVDEILGATHVIERSYRETDYLSALPIGGKV